jgi:hypothetical protein
MMKARRVETGQLRDEREQLVDGIDELQTDLNVSSGMARMAGNAAGHRRDAVDVRVRKDLGVESEARSQCNDASEIE